MSDTQRWMIDSIEEGIAAVEVDNGARVIYVPVGMLPAGAAEGDVLRVTREEVRVVIELDPEAREEALRRSREQTKARPNPRDPGGPIRL